VALTDPPLLLGLVVHFVPLQARLIGEIRIGRHELDPQRVPALAHERPERPDRHPDRRRDLAVVEQHRDAFLLDVLLGDRHVVEVDERLARDGLHFGLGDVAGERRELHFEVDDRRRRALSPKKNQGKQSLPHDVFPLADLSCSIRLDG